MSVKNIGWHRSEQTLAYSRDSMLPERQLKLEGGKNPLTSWKINIKKKRGREELKGSENTLISAELCL